MNLEWMDQVLREPFKMGLVAAVDEHGYCEHAKTPVGVLQGISRRGAKHRIELVDEGVAPLIYLLWKHDVDVRASCEDDSLAPGSVYLAFSRAADFEHFLDLCVNDELAARVFEAEAKRWFIGCSPVCQRDDVGLTRAWALDFSVWLPPDDFPDLLTDELRAA